MVCLYENLNYSDEVEIFRRVQNGESMTAVELMRSHNPELISYIRKETQCYDALLCLYNVKIKKPENISHAPGGIHSAKLGRRDFFYKPWHKSVAVSDKPFLLKKFTGL